MTPEIDLKELSTRESERVEWKENGDDIDVVQGIVKTISAFANDISNLGGGYVICGAKEGKDEHGFPQLIYKGLSSSKLKEIEGKVLQSCREATSPPIIPIVTELENPKDSSTRILVFTILASPDIHSFRDKNGAGQAYYVRISRETREAKNGVLTQLLVKKNKIDYFDKRVNSSATEADIDVLVLRDYLQEMGLLFIEKPLEDYLSDRSQIADLVPPLLGRNNLDNVLRPRNFTLLMFGKKESVTRLFPEAYTILSIYPGKDRSEPTAERYILTGNIVDQAKKSIELLNTHSYTSFDKTSNKPNQVKYPLRALQEAVVNAIVHRDYEVPSPNRITVFSDRIEVNSAGSLHWSVDKEKFLKGLASPKWRNQCFAYLFNKLQLAQSEGQGIPTIFRTMKEEGCPTPIFDVEAENIICTLPAHPRHQLIKDLQNIQDDIILGKYPEARSKLKELLINDPYNYRTLDLYCEVLNKMKIQKELFNFLVNRNIDLNAINTNTLINIAETLPNDDEKSKQIASKAISIAMNGRIEENSIIKAVLTLKKIGEPEEVINVITDSINKFPNLTNNPILLDKRAQSKMDIAKKCMESARDSKSRPQTKARAWEKTRELLNEAERDLMIAHEYSEFPNEKYWIERDIEFLEKMKKISRKPERR